jgi:hypothetical protein
MGLASAPALSYIPCGAVSRTNNLAISPWESFALASSSSLCSLRWPKSCQPASGFVSDHVRGDAAHAINCICDPGEHNPLYPMHRHLVGSQAGIVTAGDGSCQVITATIAPLPGFDLPTLPEQVFQSKSPAGATPPPWQRSRLGSVDLLPPRT